MTMYECNAYKAKRNILTVHPVTAQSYDQYMLNQSLSPFDCQYILHIHKYPPVDHTAS